MVTLGEMLASGPGKTHWRELYDDLDVYVDNSGLGSWVGYLETHHERRDLVVGSFSVTDHIVPAGVELPCESAFVLFFGHL